MTVVAEPGELPRQESSFNVEGVTTGVTPETTLLQMYELFRQQPGVTETKGAHAFTFMTWALSATKPDLVKPGKFKLQPAVTRTLMEHTQAAGFAAGDNEDFDRVCEKAEKAIVDAATAKNRSSVTASTNASTYLHAGRTFLRFMEGRGCAVRTGVVDASESGVPYIRKLSLQEFRAFKRRFDALVILGDALVRLHDDPYCFDPIVPQERGRLQNLRASQSSAECAVQECRLALEVANILDKAKAEKALKAAEKELARCQKAARDAEEHLKTDRWAEGAGTAQEAFDEIVRWATGEPNESGAVDVVIDSDQENIARTDALRLATIINYATALGSYFGYLVNETHLLPRSFSGEELWRALDNKDWLIAWAKWMVDRARKARSDKDFVPNAVKMYLTQLRAIVWRCPVSPYYSKQGFDDPAKYSLAVYKVKIKAPHTKIKKLKADPKMLPDLGKIIRLSLKIWNSPQPHESRVMAASRKLVSIILHAMVYFPMRRKNWIEAEFGVHIIREEDLDGNTTAYKVDFPEGMVKNKRALSCRLPRRLWKRLDEYLGVGEWAVKEIDPETKKPRRDDHGKVIYKPNPESPRETLLNARTKTRGKKANRRLMFPAPGAVQFDGMALGREISRWSASDPELNGFILTPHLLRDCVAHFHLTATKPWGQRLLLLAFVLGDEPETVIKHYGGLEQDDAVAAAAEYVDEEVERDGMGYLPLHLYRMLLVMLDDTLTEAKRRWLHSQLSPQDRESLVRVDAESLDEGVWEGAA